MITRGSLIAGLGACALLPPTGATNSNVSREDAMRNALRTPGTLAFYAAKQNLLFGTMIGRGFFAESDYADTVLRECSLIYASLASTGATRRSPGGFDFSLSDEQVNFAMENHLAVAGGYLIVHDGVPQWITPITSRERALAELQLDVSTPMKHYRDQFDHWIVVNEALGIPGRNPPYSLRDCTWLSTIGGDVDSGTDYISEAFRAARNADKNAVLVINDNGLEGDLPAFDRKRACMLALLKTLKRNKVPVDALGLQAHLLQINSGINPTLLNKFLTDVHDLGFKILITELDVVDAELPPDMDSRDAIVAESLRRFLTAVLSHPGVTTINAWGLSDNNSWYNQASTPTALRRRDGLESRGTPFDHELRKKAAYFSIRDALSAATRS
jgi:endo-1,4-beta-xylanase